MREMNGDEFTSSNVDAWFRLQGIQPKPQEVQAVMVVQNKFIKSRAAS